MSAPFATHINGQPATAGHLAPLSFAGFAHFTAMQIRDGRVRGLDLHLERLRAASMEMYGHAMPDDRVRAYLKAALESSPPDVSLIATMYSRTGEFTSRGAGAELDVLIRTGPPSSGPSGPLALAVVEYERVLPSIKHVGEVAKTYYMRKAVERGYDDAAFVDRHGSFSEASIWNLAFWDGDCVVWPDAAMLTGITMSIVRRQLLRLGVPQRTQQIKLENLPELSSAVVMNSWTSGVPIRRIGAVNFSNASDFLGILQKAYDAEPLVAP